MKITKETDRKIALRYLIGLSNGRRRAFLRDHFNYMPVPPGVGRVHVIKVPGLPITEELLKSRQVRA